MSALPHRRCELGSPGPLRDRLVEAVVNEDKTAASSLLSEWHAEGQKLPHVGERQVVVDSAARPVAVIEIIGVEVTRLGDADLDLAIAEGEGYGSVDDWREAHEHFWAKDAARRTRPGRHWHLDDDTEVVVEHFRLVTQLTD